MAFVPTASIFIAKREAKCRIASLRWAAQNRPPTQRATASPSARLTSDPLPPEVVHLEHNTVDLTR